MSHSVVLHLVSYDVFPPLAHQVPTVSCVQEVLCQDLQVVKLLIAKRVLIGHSNINKNDSL